MSVCEREREEQRKLREEGLGVTYRQRETKRDKNEKKEEKICQDEIARVEQIDWLAMPDTSKHREQDKKERKDRERERPNQ